MRTVTVLNSNFTSKRLQQLAYTFSHQKTNFFVQNFLLSYLKDFYSLTQFSSHQNKQRIRQKVAAKSTTQKIIVNINYRITEKERPG